ncbi:MULTISPECIES: phage tail protein [unclassified Enterobacter cloacae complex]|uniref:phage tail protein n=1 Tax=unclassified Enterobacter cloacae complex TaxID=2757714 RepID=UPI000B50929F|nr:MULTISPECIES: phage tail protein [unclassified Enterobacter cloacae complex]EFF9395600.1 phage tail protein [Escherichia coli]ASD59997.1 phage tail protein [Enterobacter cloacae complex sp. ECNIH7]EHH6310980.1 phage tail protein [Escherichia coli]POV42529.1 phage tail protein [Enterobacter cloacae complex sp. ECNIH11]POV46076.1 phage tail protein [Enterobacter cloacae complex sp. ECNIH16]
MLRIGQVEATATQDGKYTDGSVAGGIAATRLRAAAFNAMQEELAHIVESAGLALDINDMTQVLKAIQKLTLSRANPFADIKSDGAAAIATALSNLGLGAGAPAIGIPFFWPSSAMPNTVMPEWSNMVFLKFNGATFSAATYPKLALVFPGLVLTESRGEFLRIWDDGRGVDAGRGLLSAQGHAYQSHSHRLLMSAGSAGSGNVIGIDSSLNGTLTYNINQPGGGQIQAIENAGDTETRPRNIAFNFLVRAK